MSKAPWNLVSQVAADMVRRNPPIPYSDMDCQAFVKMCVMDAGGKMDYAGSNDMFRNACTKVMTLKDARAQGLLHSGCLLFIVEQGGDYPAKYHADGLGNASHVGLYLDLKVLATGETIEVAHSSYSRGMVCASTLENGWTHVGWAKEIDYGDAVEAEEPTGSAQSFRPWRGIVGNMPSDEHLIMRETPAGKFMLKIPCGAEIVIQEEKIKDGKSYGRTEYSNHNGKYTGWVDLTFVSAVATTDIPDTSVDETPATGYHVTITGLRGAPLTLSQASSIRNEYTAVGYDAEVSN